MCSKSTVIVAHYQGAAPAVELNELKTGIQYVYSAALRLQELDISRSSVFMCVDKFTAVQASISLHQQISLFLHCIRCSCKINL